MIQILSPHPDYKQTLWLPNPEWGDTRRSESTMQLKRSMNGAKVVTHVRKQPNSFSMEMLFELTRLKSLELLEFIAIHAGNKMKMIDHKAVERIGYLIINPLELEKVRRSIVGSSTETVNTRLDFETVQ